MLVISGRDKPSPKRGKTMTKQTFETPEAYILGQKYNVLNRKAKKVQKLIGDDSKVFIPYKGLVVIVDAGPEKTVTTTVSGSMFFPDVHVKTEDTFKP